MSTQREQEDAQSLCTHFIKSLFDQNFSALRNSFGEEFEAYYPQTNESVSDPESYMEIWRRLPGTHSYQMWGGVCEYDVWDKQFTTSIQIQVKTKLPDGIETACFHIFVIEVDRENQIRQIIEYTAPAYTPPEWRKNLVTID